MINIKDLLSSCIREEAKSLSYLADSIDDVDLIFLREIRKCKGNVIVSGIGKSFIVGSKIAGTLSSIGVPTIPISVSDLLHGNIGMIRPSDLFIIISNSGETQEVVDLVKHLRTIGNYTILSITGNKVSTLAELSQVSKIIKVEEIGPLSIIPTSSTTAVMAYGDALAMALAQMSGLTLCKFRTFHPGGKIGSM